MSVIEFGFSLTGPDMPRLFRQAVATGHAGDGPPEALLTRPRIRKPPGVDWIDRYLPVPKPARGAGFMAKWDRLNLKNEGFVSWRSRQPVKVSRLGVQIDLTLAWTLLRQLDFRVCGSCPNDNTWNQDDTVRQVYAGFSDGHYTHGWMCAFRGDGHDSVVSRRWLEYGPWILLRDEDHDISLILFHDPDERDPHTQAEQAASGHVRMGIHDRGGFIQQGDDPETGNFQATGGYRTHADLRGFYVASDRTFRIVVAGREVSQREMLDACAYRLHHRADAEQPVENVAFVFPEPERARAHLHELWLRELQCRTFEDGREVRLDLDYSPTPPEPPAWARAWVARQAKAPG